MNLKMILYTLGNLLKVTAALLVLPILVSLVYKEYNYILCFATPLIEAFLLGWFLSFRKPKNTTIYATEGFVIVGLSWILISLFGSMPFMISKTIPRFIDAFFETVSGFTTTGSSILSDIESTFEGAHGVLFWRSFTHWVGGMGVLVFILAFMPNVGETFYIMKAESPGPQVGKLVSKVKLTARILYFIYIGLTVLEIIVLWIGRMPLYDSIITSFGTAGTGGFGMKNDSISGYNNFCQIIIGVFMMLFGVNFNLFYLIVIGKIKQALKSEELMWYLSIIMTSIVAITINLVLTTTESLGTIIRNSFFTVVSFITTTGFSNSAFETWPLFSQTILFLLMFVGACAGSTGGGIKVSRIAILVKSSKREIQNLIHPNAVSSVRFEGQKVEDSVVRSIKNFFVLYMFIFVACLLVLSLDKYDHVTNITAVASAINNIGPGLGHIIGSSGNYGGFNTVSKLVLIFAMFVGRLEIYPIIILLNRRAWTNK